jgi:hypothetical protein
MLNPEVIKDSAKIVNEAMKDKVQANLIINNRAGGNAPESPRRSLPACTQKNSKGYSDFPSISYCLFKAFFYH